MTPKLEVSALRDCAHVRVSGSEAEAFLHGQLSLDLHGLARANAPLAGWHDARGRLLALVRILRLGGGWLLVTDESLLENLVTGLRKYVLRSDVGIEPDRDWHALAVVGDASSLLEQHGVELERTGRDALAVAGGCCWIRVGPELIELHGSEASLDALGLEALGLEARGTSQRAALEAIALGLPRVTLASSGAYLPQMLNLDRLGAVSFTKGCYPGQEVIARTHNLGTVKRRLRRFAADPSVEAAAGMALVDAAGEVVGETLQAARVGERQELLAVVRLSALDAPVYPGDPTRPALSALALPYERAAAAG